MSSLEWRKRFMSSPEPKAMQPKLITHVCRCGECGRNWAYKVGANTASAKRKYDRCWECAADIWNAYVLFVWQHRSPRSEFQ